MKRSSITAFGAALVAVFVSSASGAVTVRDKDTVDMCLTLPVDDMVDHVRCRDLMRRWNVTTADMVMMMACRAMSMEAISKDADCKLIREKHPDILAAALTR